MCLKEVDGSGSAWVASSGERREWEGGGRDRQASRQAGSSEDQGRRGATHIQSIPEKTPILKIKLGGSRRVERGHSHRQNFRSVDPRGAIKEIVTLKLLRYNVIRGDLSWRVIRLWGEEASVAPT